jgi:hypothetical protein
MYQKRLKSMFELGSRRMLPTFPPKSSGSFLLQRESTRTNGSLDGGQSIAQKPDYLLSTSRLPGTHSPDVRIMIAGPRYGRDHQ